MNLEAQITVLEREVKTLLGMYKAAVESGSEFWRQQNADEIREKMKAINDREDLLGVRRTPPPIEYEDKVYVSSTRTPKVMALITKDIGVTIYPGTTRKRLENDPELHVTFIRRDVTGGLDRLMPCATPDIHEDDYDVPVRVYSHVVLKKSRSDPKPVTVKVRPMTERDMYEDAVLETAVRMFARDGFHGKGQVHWVRRKKFAWRDLLLASPKQRRSRFVKEKVTRQFIKYPHVGGLGGKLIRRLLEGVTILKLRETPMEFFRNGRKIISYVEPKYSCDWQQRKELVGKLKALMESKRMEVSRNRLKKEGQWTVPSKPLEKVF